MTKNPDELSDEELDALSTAEFVTSVSAIQEVWWHHDGAAVLENAATFLVAAGISRRETWNVIGGVFAAASAEFGS